MEKTLSWCADHPFYKFGSESASLSDRTDLTPIEEDNVMDVDLGDYDEIFSEDEYDFVPDRPTYPHTGEINSSPTTAHPPVENLSDFTAEEVDLLNRLIDSQFSPGRSRCPPRATSPGREDGLRDVAVATPEITRIPVGTKRTSPLVTSEILENVSFHNFPPSRLVMNGPSLLYQFDAEDDSHRRHRHQPRRVKFVYEDPTVHLCEEEEVPVPEKTVMPAAVVVAVPIEPPPKGKGKFSLKDKAAGSKGKASKSKALPPIRSPHHDAGPAVPLVPPLDLLVWDTPVWRTDNETHLQFHNKRAWVVEKKRRKHWFRLDKLISETTTDETPDTRPPLWTKNGDRIPAHYSLRFVIKSPKTMQLFFFQKQKRYVLMALRVFFLFSEQSTKMKLRILSIPGVVRRLVQVMTYQRGLPQRLAIMLLASLSHANVFVRLFCKAAGLRKLEPIIRNSRDPELSVWLTLLIRNLSQSKFVQRQFLEMFLLDVMLDLVSRRNQEPDVVKYVLQTLYFVCRNRTIRTYLVVRGSFSAIGDLLFSSYKYIQYLTFRLLLKLLRTKSGKPIYRFDKGDGMDLLIAFISDITQRKFFPLCIEIFEYVLLAPAIARKMIDNGLYRIMMDLAMDRIYENIDSVQEFALKAVTRAAETEDERRIMHELGYEPNVVFFFKSNEVRVQVAALQAIAGLCRRLTNQSTLFDLGVHRIIMFTMEGAHSDVREWAFFAIAFLMFRNKNIMNSMVNKGLGDVIYEALQDESETWETKGNALLCAILLRKNEQVRQQLRINIPQSIPHWLLNANQRIRNYAAVSIGIFVTDQETRRHFAECRGYKALSMACTMSQIRSREKPELEFMRNLCFGIGVLSVHEEIVWSMINADSLTPLWLLKNEPDRVCQGYVGFALHRIVALDAFFRYFLLGTLDSQIKIPHGLHEQDVITLANPLRPIEYFLNQGPMGDKSIVYISLPKKYWRQPQTAESCSYRAPKDGLEFLCHHDAGIEEKASIIGKAKPMRLARLEQRLPPQDFWTCAPYNPDLPPDLPLKSLLKKSRKSVAESPTNVQGSVMTLATIVVEQMGGPIGSRTIHDWVDCVDISLSFLKRKLHSNCVPLGMIEEGNSLHRALLFKVLADVCELPATLIRSESPSQGWIEIQQTDALTTKPQWFVVDLLYEPGTLLAKTSPLAKQYMQSPTLPQATGNLGNRLSYSIRDVRPLRGVISDARQQLLLSYAPLHYTKNLPDRLVQVTSGRKKVRLFQLTRTYEGPSVQTGRSRYRTRIVRLFQNFVTRSTVQGKRNSITAKKGQRKSRLDP